MRVLARLSGAVLPLATVLLLGQQVLPARAFSWRRPVSQSGAAMPPPASLTGDSLRAALVNVPFSDSELPSGLSSPGAASVVAPPNEQGAPMASNTQTIAALLAGPGLVGQISYVLFPDSATAQTQFEQDAVALSPNGSTVSAGSTLPSNSACGVVASGSTAPQALSCIALVDSVEVIATLSPTSSAASISPDVTVALERTGIDHLAAVAQMGPSAAAVPNPILATSDKVANALFSTPVDSSEMPSGFASVLINAGSADGPAGMSYNLTFGVSTATGQASGQFTYSVYPGPVEAKSGFDFAAGQATQAGVPPDSPQGFQFPIACFNSGQTSGPVTCSVLVGPVLISAQTGDNDGAHSLAAVAVSHLAHALQAAGG